MTPPLTSTQSQFQGRAARAALLRNSPLHAEEHRRQQGEEGHRREGMVQSEMALYGRMRQTGFNRASNFLADRRPVRLSGKARSQVVPACADSHRDLRPRHRRAPAPSACRWPRVREDLSTGPRCGTDCEETGKMKKGGPGVFLVAAPQLLC
jgi:hypothetical protein